MRRFVVLISFIVLGAGNTYGQGPSLSGREDLAAGTIFEKTNRLNVDVNLISTLLNQPQLGVGYLFTPRLRLGMLLSFISDSYSEGLELNGGGLGAFTNFFYAEPPSVYGLNHYIYFSLEEFQVAAKLDSALLQENLSARADMTGDVWSLLWGKLWIWESGLNLGLLAGYQSLSISAKGYSQFEDSEGLSEQEFFGDKRQSNGPKLMVNLGLLI